MPAMGHKVGTWLCESLGIDPVGVVEIELVCPVGDMATVVVTRIVEGDFSPGARQVYKVEELG